MDFFTLFAEDRFSCLDYHDVASLDDAQKETIVEVMNDALHDFLIAAGYTHITREHDLFLRNALWDWARADLSRATGHSVESLNPVLEQAATGSEYYYPFASHELRLCMAKATALALSADDFFLPAAARKELPYLQSRIWQGLKPREEWCIMFVDMIREFTELYGCRDPLIGTVGATGWGNYIDGWCLEDRLASFAPKTNAGPAEDFPAYIRSVTGAALPYAVAIFKPTREIEVPYGVWLPYLPDVTAAINFINDVLSFPKEVLKCDQSNYVTFTTKMKRAAGCKSRFPADGGSGLWTVRDTVCGVFERALCNILALDRGLWTCTGCSTPQSGLPTPTKEVLDSLLAATLWANFKQGYIAWHLNCGRYPLKSLKRRLEGDGGKKVHLNGNGVHGH